MRKGSITVGAGPIPTTVEVGNVVRCSKESLQGIRVTLPLKQNNVYSSSMDDHSSFLQGADGCG